MEKILAGYIRVSTEMQVEKDSLINQEESTMVNVLMERWRLTRR